MTHIILHKNYKLGDTRSSKLGSEFGYSGRVLIQSSLVASVVFLLSKIWYSVKNEEMITGCDYDIQT